MLASFWRFCDRNRGWLGYLIFLGPPMWWSLAGYRAVSAEAFILAWIAGLAALYYACKYGRTADAQERAKAAQQAAALVAERAIRRIPRVPTTRQMEF